VTIVDFRTRVCEQAPPCLSQESLKFAVQYCQDKEKTAEVHITRCLDLASLLDQYWTSRQTEEASIVNASPNADEDSPRTPPITRDDYLDQVQPLVRSCRQNIFQQDYAPFTPNKEDAAAWIQGQAAEPWRASSEEQARLSQMDQDLRTLHHEWRVRTGVEWRDDGGHDFLAYQDGEEGGVKTISLAGPDLWDEYPAMPPRKLLELQHSVENMADVTGFYKDRLVTYILTGIPPELPPIKATTSLTFHDLTDISRTQVTIDLLTGDVKDEELRQAYRQVRKRFSTTSKKRLPKNEEFLALVKQHGPVPQGRGSGAMAFWEIVRQAWNKKSGRTVWREPAAARKHYNRHATHTGRKRSRAMPRD
jgi:hypothetical protein